MGDETLVSGGTIRQAAILVGGLGSRLGPLARAMPKPLLRVGDRPFLAWLLRELCRYGVREVLLLAGHLAELVVDALPELAASLPRAMRLEVLREPPRAGTGGALWHAAPRLDERFLLLNGDSLFDTNLAALLADAAADPPGVLARLLVRRTADSGRYGAAGLDGDRIVAFSERPDTTVPGSGPSNAGIAVVRRELLQRARPQCSLEHDILPLLAAGGALRGTLRSGWFVDIGVPEDLARARAELPELMARRRALFLDRDGVLNVDHGYVGGRDRFEWVDGARAAVRAACDAGWHVFLATNQSGVARGFYDEAAVQGLYAWMLGALHAAGGTIDDWRFCPTHPEGSVAAYAREHDWRKPRPGMLLDMLRAWRLDPARCLMVGDQPTDMQAAAAAEVAGHMFAGGDLHRFVVPLVGVPA